MVGCPQCGTLLAAGMLVCPQCGALVYNHALNALAREAASLEAHDPAQAALVWQRAMQLLPAGSQPHQSVAQRAAALASGVRVEPIALSYAAPPPKPPDAWPTAVGKTLASMLVSIIVYAMIPGWGGVKFAIGFTALILVHEMGHVLAMWYYGLSASPPIFIPFVGALINLRQNPPNAKVEAIIGIAGPVAGTLGSIACYALYLFVPGLHYNIVRELAAIGFFMNLFNLLPVPPLDGGRITAAVSPWIWIAGLAALVGLILSDLWHQSYAGVGILLLVLFYAIPRVRVTLRARGRDIPYYRISRVSSWTIGILYVALAVSLLALLWRAGALELLG